MRVEAPQFKRCCFCVPLRPGLVAWGYVKLGLITFAIAYIVAITLLNFQYIKDSRVIMIIAIIVAVMIVDLSFNIIFVVGSHKKSLKLLKFYYIYSVIYVGLMLLNISFLLYKNFNFIYNIWQFDSPFYAILEILISTGIAVSVTFVQIYLILLIRSEMVKLREQTLEIQFSNHLAAEEPQCTLHNACCLDRVNV